MEMFNYESRIENARKVINEDDYILIGAGAGLSAAAGLEYSGDKFKNNFEDFIDKYGFTDLYTATFYDFPTQEEKWAFWARLINLNRYNKEPLKLYREIFDLVKNKEHFVLTTNVDAQFEIAGFNKENIFATQGDYGMLQCSKACHNKLYSNKELVVKWLKDTKDCKVPSDEVMYCPVCNEEMDVNLRKDSYFVEDDYWYKQNDKYNEFLNKIKGKKVALIEIGVGFNTPGIIRFPFEQLVKENQDYSLIRINKEHPESWNDLGNNLIAFNEDTNKIIEDLRNKNGKYKEKM